MPLLHPGSHRAAGIFAFTIIGILMVGLAVNYAHDRSSSATVEEAAGHLKLYK